MDGQEKIMDATQCGLIENPYVTVIVPVYNEEGCVKDCITTLLAQDFKPLEILAVDDGSTDNSRAVCEGLKIKVIKSGHKGMGAARNLGARNAAGNILVMVDADMVFAPDYVSKLVAPIISGKTVATCHWNEMVANWDNPWARCQTWFKGLADRRRHPEAVTEKSGGQYRAVRKEFFLDNGGLDEKPGYKADISLALHTGVFAQIIPDAICYHRNIESPGEAFKEALWQGRNIAVVTENRLKRCFLSVLLHNNLLRGVLRGVRLSILKKEPRLVIYGIIHSIGFNLGTIHGLITGDYQK